MVYEEDFKGSLIVLPGAYFSLQAYMHVHKTFTCGVFIAISMSTGMYNLNALTFSSYNKPIKYSIRAQLWEYPTTY